MWDYTTCRILNPLSLHPKQITVVCYLLHFPFPTESFLAPFPLPNITTASYFSFILHFSRPLFFLSPSVLNHLFLVSLALLFLITFSLFHSVFFMNVLSPPPSKAKYHDKKENIKYSIHELKNFTNELWRFKLVENTLITEISQIWNDFYDFILKRHGLVIFSLIFLSVKFVHQAIQYKLFLMV